MQHGQSRRKEDSLFSFSRNFAFSIINAYFHCKWWLSLSLTHSPLGFLGFGVGFWRMSLPPNICWWMLQTRPPLWRSLSGSFAVYQWRRGMWVCMIHIHLQENNPGWLPIFVFLTEWMGGDRASDVDDGEGVCQTKRGYSFPRET